MSYNLTKDSTLRSVILSCQSAALWTVALQVLHENFDQEYFGVGFISLTPLIEDANTRKEITKWCLEGKIKIFEIRDVGED